MSDGGERLAVQCHFSEGASSWKLVHATNA